MSVAFNWLLMDNNYDRRIFIYLPTANGCLLIATKDVCNMYLKSDILSMFYSPTLSILTFSSWLTEASSFFIARGGCSEWTRSTISIEKWNRERKYRWLHRYRWVWVEQWWVQEEVGRRRNQDNLRFLRFLYFNCFTKLLRYLCNNKPRILKSFTTLDVGGFCFGKLIEKLFFRHNN